MLLRPSLTRSVTQASTLLGPTEKRVAAFAQCPVKPNLTSRAPRNHRYASSSSNNQNGSCSSSSQRANAKRQANSLRPFTVLALCIPLGYALSWYNEATPSSSTYRTSDGFTKYILESKTVVSSTSSIFTLVPASAKHSLDFRDPHQSGDTHNDGQDGAAPLTPAHSSIWIVQIKQPMLQIMRSYTLLPPSPRPFLTPDVENNHNNSNDNETNSQRLRFLIRKEYRGEVSGYLYSLPLGAEIEVRGPIAEAVIPKGKAVDRGRDSVVVLAGGTGIAPALRVADILGGRTGPERQTDLQILWACRQREDCIGGRTTSASKSMRWDFSGWWTAFGLLSSDLGTTARDTNNTTTTAITHRKKDNEERGVVVNELHELQRRFSKPSSGKTLEATNTNSMTMTVEYFVDEENTFISPRHLSTILSKASANTGDPNARKIIYVSGPDGFVEYWAGAKVWRDGWEVAGPLGGVLGSMNLDGWEVVKL